MISLSLPWFRRRASSGAVVAPVVEDGYPFVDLAGLALERSVSEVLPEDLARRIDGVCIGRPSSGEIAVAVVAPDVHVYDQVLYVTGLKAVLVRASAELVGLAHEYVYRAPSVVHGVPWGEWLAKKKYHSDSLCVVQDSVPELGEDARGPAIEAVDRVIKEAISIGASDIHVETYEREVVLRYRIDGVLHTVDTWPRAEAAGYIKRVKIMAQMDVSQEMVPQGGRISVRVSDQELDLRVSALPVPDGESLVLRLLRKGGFDLGLEDLGFDERGLRVYQRMASAPHGMVLVSGPTGSGKTTTLYATLASLNRPDRKILTVEDPIEYRMPGVVQVQVNMSPREDEKRLTFARALREFLRHDPDVILIGEMRDDETAAIGVQAALTGHLVLSTIHTNDAAGIVTRLRDRGVEPFLIASTLVGGIAQRLVRRTCLSCRREVAVPPGFRGLLEAEGLDVPCVFAGTGCSECHRTGYRGRVALYEVLEVDDRVREMIGARASDAEIKRVAAERGMKTLLQAGLAKVARGLVSVEEVQRVCLAS